MYSSGLRPKKDVSSSDKNDDDIDLGIVLITAFIRIIKMYESLHPRNLAFLGAAAVRA